MISIAENAYLINQMVGLPLDILTKRFFNEFLEASEASNNLDTEEPHDLEDSEGPQEALAIFLMEKPLADRLKRTSKYHEILYIEGLGYTYFRFSGDPLEHVFSKIKKW